MGDNILLNNDVEISAGKIHTRKFLKHLKLVTGKLLDKVPPISLEEYIKEFKSLRESTSSGTSIVTLTMINTKVLDPELR